MRPINCLIALLFATATALPVNERRSDALAERQVSLYLYANAKANVLSLQFGSAKQFVAV
ncbi:hypothetical protein N7450_000369 [Penicillium hetheringtonii]|uniref:Uncharacterized protein n=1 Tax=Penicillium hetheringtonii TaxID=911720 RepID=A0AAD6E2J2_9EURO|nr:hypothetical protein N7450_000369 [Penicillium hetheringtonii]